MRQVEPGHAKFPKIGERNDGSQKSMYPLRENKSKGRNCTRREESMGSLYFWAVCLQTPTCSKNGLLKKNYLQMRKNWNSSTHENISSTVAASLRVCNKVFAQLWCIKGIALLPTENRAQVQGSVGASILVTCMRRDSEQDPGGCSMPTGKLERTTRYLLMKAAYAFHAQILRSETGSYSHLPLYKIHFTNLLHF